MSFVTGVVVCLATLGYPITLIVFIVRYGRELDEMEKEGGEKEQHAQKIDWRILFWGSSPFLVSLVALSATSFLSPFWSVGARFAMVAPVIIIYCFFLLKHLPFREMWKNVTHFIIAINTLVGVGSSWVFTYFPSDSYQAIVAGVQVCGNCLIPLYLLKLMHSQFSGRCLRDYVFGHHGSD